MAELAEDENGNGNGNGNEDITRHPGESRGPWAKKREFDMEASDWAELFCSEEEWAKKKQKIIAALNKQYGDGFASAHGEF